MEIIKKSRKFQEGGAIPAEAPVQGGAPEGEAQDPMAQVLQVAAQALENQDCEAAMAVCQALMQLLQGGAPAPAPQEPSFARHGAKLVRVRR